MFVCQKEKFDLPEGVTYLNCAYMGPTPRAAEAAGIAALAQKSKPWEITGADFFEPGKRVKRRFAQLINAADPDRIAVLPSVSYGMACVAKNISPQAGQNIVLLEEQFPSNFYTWKRLADETGAVLRTVQAPDTLENRGEKWNEKLLASIDDETVLVALPHVHWADGTRFDLAAVRQRSREVGALMVVDGTQSVGAMPFDVAAVQPDALICCGYKWMLGPYTSTLAYFGPAFDGGTPIEENWINRLHSEDFQQLVNYQPEYKPLANRYSMGQQSQFVAMAMLEVTLGLLLEWGSENIQAYCRHISEPSLDQLAELGVWTENPAHRGQHLLGLRLPANVPMEVLKAKASEAGIFVSFRGNAVRVSPQVYNEAADLEKLTKVVRACMR